MAEKTKKLSERARDLLDALIDAVESLINPAPAPVPVRVKRPRRR